MAANYTNNVRLGIWLDDLRLGIKQALKTVAPWAPEAVGLDAFGLETSPRALSQTGRRDLSQYIRSRGASLACLRADVGGRRLADPRGLDVNLLRLREAMQLAVDLGARRLVVPAGYVPAGDQGADASACGALAEAARTLAALSASSGVRVGWLGGSEPPEALQNFLNRWDAGGALEVDLNPAGYIMRGVEPLKALNLLDTRVMMATAADRFRGGGEAPFGQGDVRWGEIVIGLSTLKRPQPIDLIASCALEGDRVAAVGAAYRKLQALRKNPLE